MPVDDPHIIREIAGIPIRKLTRRKLGTIQVIEEPTFLSPGKNTPNELEITIKAPALLAGGAGFLTLDVQAPLALYGWTGRITGVAHRSALFYDVTGIVELHTDLEVLIERLHGKVNGEELEQRSHPLLSETEEGLIYFRNLTGHLRLLSLDGTHRTPLEHTDKSLYTIPW